MNSSKIISILAVLSPIDIHYETLSKITGAKSSRGAASQVGKAYRNAKANGYDTLAERISRKFVDKGGGPSWLR